MSTNNLNDVWNYLLSNNDLTNNLMNIQVYDGGNVNLVNECINPILWDDEKKKMLMNFKDCKDSINRSNNKYGIKMILLDNDNKMTSIINTKGLWSFDGLINFVYIQDNFQKNLNLNFINNYRYNVSEKNIGIPFDAKLDKIFKELINNLQIPNLSNIIRYDNNDIKDGILIIKNEPINAIVYIEKQSGNYYLSFPIGSNIILVVYDSSINFIISFNNEKTCPPEKICPPEKTCPPEKICPIPYLLYFIIFFLIMILLILFIINIKSK
jgi:hypothetical protein